MEIHIEKYLFENPLLTFILQVKVRPSDRFMEVLGLAQLSGNGQRDRHALPAFIDQMDADALSETEYCLIVNHLLSVNYEMGKPESQYICDVLRTVFAT